MRADFPKQTLKELIIKYIPEAKEKVSFRPIPTGKFNRSYYVSTPRGEFVLRIAPPPGTTLLFYEKDMMRQEPVVHEIVLKKTSVPVPKIIAFDDSFEVVNRMFLIMEKLPGRALSEVAIANYDEILTQVGACLSQIHRIHGEKYGYVGPHKPMDPQDSWCEAFRIMWRKLIDDIQSTGHYSPQEGKALKNLLDSYLEYFERPVPPSLLHMDIWSQNILIDREGTLTGIVDWDRALWGDPEIEFAVLDYCGISEPAFWKGYAAERDTSAPARLRGIFYFLYELQKYIVIRHGRNHDPVRAAAYKQSAFSLLDRAFGKAWRK